MNDRQSFRASLILMANVLCAPLLSFPAYPTVAQMPFPSIRTFVLILCSSLAVTSFLLSREHRRRKPVWLTAWASVVACGIPPIFAWVWTLRDLLGHDPVSLLRSSLLGALHTAPCWILLAVGNALAVRRLPDLGDE